MLMTLFFLHVYTSMGFSGGGLSVTVRLNDSLFAITADLINGMIKMSVCLAFFFPPHVY